MPSEQLDISHHHHSAEFAKEAPGEKNGTNESPAEEDKKNSSAS
jgi:hypothetical protein